MGSNRHRFLPENVINTTNKPHIYKITNNINNKYYIGVHSGTETDTYCGSGELINKAYDKYGVENFTKTILETFDTQEEAYKAEETYCNQAIVDDKMSYNLCLGGHNGSFISLNKSKEHRERMSKFMTGRKMSAESIKKLSNTKKGKKLSVETKRKMSEAQKGRKISEEHKEKLRQANLGKKKSKESVEKMRKALTGKANPTTSETNRKRNKLKKECPFGCGYINNPGNVGKHKKTCNLNPENK